MTYKEAIEILQQERDYAQLLPYDAALRIAIAAINKQIPKKPNCKIYTSDTRCPICNTPLCYGNNYCIDCGQKIDWRDAE